MVVVAVVAVAVAVATARVLMCFVSAVACTSWQRRKKHETWAHFICGKVSELSQVGSAISINFQGLTCRCWRCPSWRDLEK